MLSALFTSLRIPLYAPLLYLLLKKKLKADSQPEEQIGKLFVVAYICGVSLLWLLSDQIPLLKKFAEIAMLPVIKQS
jgi:hypothetical protein